MQTPRPALPLSCCHLSELFEMGFKVARGTIPGTPPPLPRGRFGDPFAGAEGGSAREAAALFQKDAAIFVPSGTMANLIAIMVHCDSRGSEMILGDKSHIHIYEQGGCSQIAAVHPRALPNLPDGTIDLSAVEDAVREPNDHFPTTRLLCLENTHNKCGGRVLTRDYMRRAAETARAHGLVLHLDGARVVNAAVALGETPAAMVEHADSASVCLSKGLGAPIGSVLLGSAEFVRRARRARKVLGGGMRQAGCIAAAGLCALADGPCRLRTDHDNAKRLAAALCEIGIDTDPTAVDSNMVMVNTGSEPATEVSRRLEERGILVIATGPRTLRVVFHHQVSAKDTDDAIAAFRDVFCHRQ
uniref:Threonine aldolase n=2 Tax=Tetraselmis sp. GSL018 TaxID=582737 RepID=A0A061RI36_9CHLO